MTAASMGGVIASTAPGAKVTTPPFSDAFTRADGDPGQPWFNPRCDVPILGIVSDTLQASNENYPRCRAGLLLDSTDLDMTFTVHFSALVTGVRDDMQFWFRANTCTPPDDGIACDAFGVTMQPNTAATGGGSLGISIYRQATSGFTLLSIRDDGLVNEGDTHTIRVHVYGNICDVYLDDLTTVYLSQVISDLNGQTACYFVAGKTGSYFDDISFVVPTSPLVRDSFDRANDSSSLGTADSGQTWIVGSGAFGTGTLGIVGDEAFAQYAAGTLNVALIDSSHADTSVSAMLALSGGGVNIGVVLRANDGNNVLYVSIGATAPHSGFVGLNKIVGGSYTLVASSTPSIAPGSTIDLDVVANGSAIDIYLNGANVLSHTLTSGEMATFLGTATKQGIQSFTDPGGDDGGSRWDNYRVFPA